MTLHSNLQNKEMPPIYKTLWTTILGLVLFAVLSESAPVGLDCRSACATGSAGERSPCACLHSGSDAQLRRKRNVDYDFLSEPSDGSYSDHVIPDEEPQSQQYSKLFRWGRSRPSSVFRWGKRTGGPSVFRWGKRDSSDLAPDYDTSFQEEKRRGGAPVFRWGKRADGPHIFRWGKRHDGIGSSVPAFRWGKRDSARNKVFRWGKRDTRDLLADSLNNVRSLGL